jgi:hypothetical protein
MSIAELLSSQIDDLRTAHEGIYRLMRKQSAALKSQDITTIAEVSSQLQSAIYELSRIEMARSAQTALLCDELQLPSTATLSDIVGKLDEPDRSRLTGEALGLRSLIGEAHELARQNEEVIAFEHNFIASLMQEVLQVPGSSADNKAAPEPDRARFVDLEA